jgi:hypothetical protein
MSQVAICTDSSALFPVGALDRLGITVVPIAITLDGEPFDAREDAIDDFYARLSEGARATTSQPSPGEFLEAYARIEADGATEVLSIHLDARVSGTLASAVLAAREAPLPVSVVDTRTVSFGVGVCVRAAAEAIASGASVRDAAAIVGRLSFVDGEEQTRDVIVLPERVLTNWWRADGHRLVLADLEDVIDELPERLIVGTGAYAQMRPDPAALEQLRQRGVEVEALPTDEAVRRYGELDPRRTAAALHLTC